MLLLQPDPTEKSVEVVELLFRQLVCLAHTVGQIRGDAIKAIMDGADLISGWVLIRTDLGQHVLDGRKSVIAVVESPSLVGCPSGSGKSFVFGTNKLSAAASGVKGVAVESG